MKIVTYVLEFNTLYTVRCYCKCNTDVTHHINPSFAVNSCKGISSQITKAIKDVKVKVSLNSFKLRKLVEENLRSSQPY